MTSAFGWLELSPAALRRMRQELAGDGEETVDEMGVLALHTGYADQFFPGTSVLHTRPRYLFFTCWNLLHLKAEQVSANAYQSTKKAAEAWVTEQLLRSGRTEPGTKLLGIIGGKIYPEPPEQPPDSSYWTALRTFGFYRGPDRATLARRWDPDRIQHLDPHESKTEKETEFSTEAFAQIRVPTPPASWQQKRPRTLLTFDLEKDEADFLLARLKSLEEHCLLGQAARLVVRMAPGGSAPWNDPVILNAAQVLGPHHLERLERARLASSLAELARAVYGALVEKVRNETISRESRKAIESPDSYQELLLSYWSGSSDVLEEARALDLAAVAGDIPALAGRDILGLLGYLQQRLLEAKALRDVRRCLLDEETERRCRLLETRRKGRRARLPRSPAGAERRSVFHHGSLNIRGLDYRWPQVRTMLRDLRQGLLT